MLDRKVQIIGTCLLFLFECRLEGQIKKFVENRTEVISNPIRVKTEVLPTISPIINIPEQRKDLIQSGLRSMGEFDVNDAGDIFIVGYKNQKNYITKLSASGEYVISFGRKGQGPGELEMPIRPSAVGDRLYITDRMKKLVIYDTQGVLINELRLPIGVDSAEPVSNEGFLLFGRDGNAPPGPDYAYYKLVLADRDLKEIRVLDRYRWYFTDKTLMPYFMWRITKDRVIVINEERNYEVWVFDFNGALVRKIRKDYLPQHADSFIRKAILGSNYFDSQKEQGYIPSPLPCMRFFISDELGRLFIMTYQRGRGPKSFVYDIFDKNGELIGKINFDFKWSGQYFGLKKFLIKNGRFYFYEEDEEGYLTMKINKIMWPDRH